MEMKLQCKYCGPFEVTYTDTENLLDQVAEHLMLKHGVVDWTVENKYVLPGEEDGSTT